MNDGKYTVLLDFVRNHRLSYAIGFLLMFAASVSQSSVPKIIGNIIDSLKTGNDAGNGILVKVALMLFVSVFAFALTFFWRMHIIVNARKMECELRGKLYEKFLSLSGDFYNVQKTGDLIAYAINDISAVRMAFGPATAMSVNGFIIFSASVFFMATTIDFRLTLMTLAPIPFVIALMILVGKQVQTRFARVQKAFGEISDRVQENIGGIRVIKAYAREVQEIKLFELLNETMMEANIHLVEASALLTPVIEICFATSFFLNLVIGGNLVLKGIISLGDFVAFNTYLAMVMAPVVSIGQVISRFHKGIASIIRLNNILNLTSSIQNREYAKDMPITGEIEFSDLSFSYPGANIPAVSRVSLKIGKGRTVGIIGRTGSGKTTLASLMLRLYETDAGELLVDGKDVKAYTIESLRKGFGYVPQDVFLFSASIRDNIAFFKDNITDAQISAAAQFAEIYDTIVSLPSGFETVLGERGVNLSGGQKQRISIARAILNDPAVLILDDALSALDALTEKKLLQNITRLRDGKTTVIITHRASSLTGADLICVMNKGTVAELGSHDELMDRKGLYFEIAEEQSKGMDPNEI